MDQGLEFCNAILASKAKLLGMQRCRRNAYRLSSDSQVKKQHAKIHRDFASTIDKDQKNWTDKVPHVPFASNTSFYPGTTYCPLNLVYLQEPKLDIDLMVDRPSEASLRDLDEYAAHMAERMRKAYWPVHEQLKGALSQAKRQYDQLVKLMQLKVGWYV